MPGPGGHGGPGGHRGGPGGHGGGPHHRGGMGGPRHPHMGGMHHHPHHRPHHRSHHGGHGCCGCFMPMVIGVCAVVAAVAMLLL